jgi:hypothetical protein
MVEEYEDKYRDCDEQEQEQDQPTWTEIFWKDFGYEI